MKRSILAVALTVIPSILAAQSAPAPPAAAPEPPRVPFTRYVMTAGDLTGDNIDESVIFDSDSKALRVIDYAGPAPLQSMGLYVKDTVTRMVIADVDGDGKAELITGEGLLGYNPKEGPQTDVSIKIYKPAAKGGWSPVEIYRKASERPDVTSLQVTDLDGDGRKDIVFAYMASKYMTDVRVAERNGSEWTVTELPTVRMGMNVAAGNVLDAKTTSIVVGRPYGDPPNEKTTTALGDAFILDGGKRIALPVTRGVSAVEVADLDGDRRDEIVVADGWHSNYGKLARSRLGIISKKGDGWSYDLVEDLDKHIRFEQIDVRDLDGDGKAEIIGRASLPAALGGTVRVYQRAGNGWRGMTVAQLAQTFAAGDFDGNGKLELLFAGQPPLPFSLNSQTTAKWETELGEAVEIVEIDPKSLVGKRAPALKTTEWVGSDPQTLAGLEGKVVLLDFWATWCKPCIDMYPEMREWTRDFGPQGLVILGITNHSRQTSAQVRRFFDRQKLPWPVAIDPKNATHVDYGVSPIPHTFLIDRNGIVRMEHRGGGDLSAIKKKLQELLSEKRSSAAK